MENANLLGLMLMVIAAYKLIILGDVQNVTLDYHWLMVNVNK